MLKNAKYTSNFAVSMTPKYREKLVDGIFTSMWKLSCTFNRPFTSADSYSHDLVIPMIYKFGNYMSFLNLISSCVFQRKHKLYIDNIRYWYELCMNVENKLCMNVAQM